MVQKYRNGGVTVTMGKPKIASVEGRCVGGGSEINAGLDHRAGPELLDEWRREFQVESLTEGDLLPDCRVLRLRRGGGKWRLAVRHAPRFVREF